MNMEEEEEEEEDVDMQCAVEDRGDGDQHGK